MTSQRFCSFSIVFCVFLLNVAVLALKYRDISDCYFFNLGNTMGKDNVTFICGESGHENRVFVESTMNCSNYSYRIGNLWPGIITFENCAFGKLNRNFFKEFPFMQTFIISNVELETLQKEIFSDATNITNLFVSQNRLIEIPPLVFFNSHKLKMLDLSQNSISRVDSLAFVGADNLQSLDLSQNNLNELDEQVLKVLSNLTKLNLSHNQLVHLNSRMLPVPKLLDLDLSYNNFTVLEEHALDNLVNLQLLNLSVNPFGELGVETFKYLTELEHLILKEIRISNIRMGTFSHQDKLISLDLSNNKLMKLNFKLFFPILHDLQSFRLANNQITDLKGFRNSLFPQLKVLDIKNNPFNCSYLEHFMESVNWEKLRLSVDPYTVDLRESSIRGIKCKTTNQIDASNDDLCDGGSSKSLSSNENILIKFLLTVICVVILAYFVIFFALNRNKIYDKLFGFRTKVNDSENVWDFIKTTNAEPIGE